MNAKKARLESKLEDDLVKACTAAGIGCHKLVEVGRKGWPDRTLMADMTPPVYVEVKRDSDHELSDHQKERKGELEARGYAVLVLDRVDQIPGIIEYVRNEAPRLITAAGRKNLYMQGIAAAGRDGLGNPLD